MDLKLLTPDTVAEVPAERLEELQPHPELRKLWTMLGWGRFSGGVVTLCDPAQLEETLADWLGGRDASRVPIGYTGLGQILYFRNLAERALSLGQSPQDAERACDVSLLDVHYKKTAMLADSAAMLVHALNDGEWLDEVLQRSVIVDAIERLGPLEDGTIFGYVPALGLGGSGEADTLQKQQAPVHWEILRQL